METADRRPETGRKRSEELRMKNEIRNTKFEIRNNIKIRNMKTTFGVDVNTCFEHLDFSHSKLFRISMFGFRIYNPTPKKLQTYDMGFGDGTRIPSPVI